MVSCRKDPHRSICDNCSNNISNNSTTYFLSDAEDLAFKEISENPNHVGHNQIVLDSVTVSCYLSKLSAIYHAALNDTGTFHDMIFKYEIHQGQRYALNGLILGFTDSSDLFNELLNNGGNTSNLLLNQLNSSYGFTNVTELSNNQLYIQSNVNYNVLYIKEQLMLIPEISEVYLNFYFLDGMSIDYFSHTDHDIFLFSYGWGDCPSGCMAKHFWKVKIDLNCNVSLEDEYGDNLPE